jgi:FSR family fosmidomycin resistance protein-like MFS transporter
MLKADFALDFWQIGLITLAGQVTASLLQPVVGHVLDRRPQPYSLAVGMGISLIALVWIATAGHFATIVAASALLGVGSAIFHPESSRIARLASGGRHGFAQSVFQTGGNAGSALGPLLASLVIVPRGRLAMAWFSVVALVGVTMLWRVGSWYRDHVAAAAARPRSAGQTHHTLSPRQVQVSMAILVALLFSKFIYLTSLTNYFTFFLIERFGASIQTAQLHLFAFLAAVTVGTFAGGSVGDRIGRKQVIWISILGVLPFSVLLPHVNLFWTGVLSVAIGLIISSAFSAVVVYAQELVPGRVGLVSGLFFGLAFGIGGIGAALLGRLADITGLVTVFHICAWLPALGLLTAWLPDIRHRRS